MNPKALQVLKLFMWGVCAFHVIVGIGLNVSPAFPQAMAGYYGPPCTGRRTSCTSSSRSARSCW